MCLTMEWRSLNVMKTLASCWKDARLFAGFCRGGLEQAIFTVFPVWAAQGCVRISFRISLYTYLHASDVFRCVACNTTYTSECHLDFTLRDYITLKKNKVWLYSRFFFSFITKAKTTELRGCVCVSFPHQPKCFNWSGLNDFIFLFLFFTVCLVWRVQIQEEAYKAGTNLKENKQLSMINDT